MPSLQEIALVLAPMSTMAPVIQEIWLPGSTVTAILVLLHYLSRLFAFGLGHGDGRWRSGSGKERMCVKTSHHMCMVTDTIRIWAKKFFCNHT